MRAVFTEKSRAEMRGKMLDAGLDIIAEKGVRNLNVEEVTRRCSIAKGTFYRFFPSKEEFVCEAITANRTDVARILESMAEEAGGKLDKEGLRTWLQLMWRNNNLYTQISPEDYVYFRSHFAQEHDFDPEAERRVSEWMLDKLEGVRPDADWKVWANLQKAIGFLGLHNDSIHQDAYIATMDRIIDAMCDELFGAS